MEEQKTKEASELQGRKRKSVIWKMKESGEDDTGMELSRVEGDFSGALGSSSLDSCSPSSAQDADDAMSASSWMSLAKWKERDW